MIEYGFFNAVNNDRLYNADSFNEFFNGIISDTGVYKKSGNALLVIPGEGMSITVSTGKARIKEHWVNVKSSETLSLEASDLTLARYDAIVLRYNAEERTINLQVIKGEFAASPTKPVLIRNTNTYDICLAYVYVGPGVNAIADTDVIDVRNDTELCGYVKLQIDAINAGIKEYISVVDITEEVTEITIGIPEFDSDNDLLFANINGVMFVKNIDFVISGTGANAKIILTNSVMANNTVEFRVIKSVIEVL